MLLINLFFEAVAILLFFFTISTGVLLITSIRKIVINITKLSIMAIRLINKVII